MPIAAGLRAGGAPAGNMLELQRTMQLQWAEDAHADAPEVLLGDLLGWRQSDLGGWMANHPGASPSAP